MNSCAEECCQMTLGSMKLVLSQVCLQTHLFVYLGLWIHFQTFSVKRLFLPSLGIKYSFTLTCHVMWENLSDCEIVYVVSYTPNLFCDTELFV